MANMLNFKFGKFGSLPSAKSAGTVYVTTDEQAMYIDLPKSHEANAELARVRVGDIIVKESSRDANPPFSEGAFYYFVAENALLRWHDGAWKQINSVSDVQADITTLDGKIDAEIERSMAKDSAHDKSISDLNTSVGQRVTTSDFNTFKSENTAAIADAKKAGTDAAAAATTADGKAVAAQSTADSALEKANDAYDLAGTKITLKEVQDLNYATKSEAKGYADAVLGTEQDTVTSVTVRGTIKKAEAAAGAATVAQGTADSAVSAAQAADAKAVAAGTAAAEAKAAAKAADDNAKTRVLKSDFETFKTTNTSAIAAVDAKAGAAQITADTAVSNAAAAQEQADKGVADAAAALAQANLMLPKAGGTMEGAINMGSKKITNLATPTSDADVATKKYVDDAKVAAIAEADAAQSTADSALSKANAALPMDGTGTMSGALNMGSKQITNMATPTADAHAATKRYVDDAIAAGIKANDAMTFKGTVGGNGATVSALPTTAQKGDTYKVAAKGKYANVEAKVGDLFINVANDDATASWTHISSGYEDDYLQKLAVNQNTIHLTDGVTNSSTGSVSGFTIVGASNSNLVFEVTAGEGDNPVHTITASMTWGTF